MEDGGQAALANYARALVCVNHFVCASPPTTRKF